MMGNLFKKELTKMAEDQTFNVAAPGAYYTSTGNDPNRSHGAVVANIHTKHGKGFWSHIQIHADDFIQYKLFNGVRLGMLLYKLKLHEPRDEEGLRPDWHYIKNQENANAKLEATLGKTFLAIDEDISEWAAKEQEGKGHRKFIKSIAKTDPENLKMIAGLKDLHDGMEAPLGDHNPENSQPMSSGTVPTITGPVSAGVVYNYQPQPAGLSVGSETLISVDPESNVTLGDGMKKAIRDVLDEPETGKAP
ncbi:hypothetical protein LCGC14_0209410 [marine sediment metagenome]|uniref:Uncharacterized protein n=1 Tax=marine sediment metagenome TaxID=412755 RepID=A0A0F9UGV3_9ZZZZ